MTTDHSCRDAFRLVPLLLVASALSIFSAVEKSATTDEPDHLSFGAAVLLGEADHASLQRMPITAVNALPLVLLGTDGADPIPSESLLIARLPTVALSLLLAWLVFRWARELYGTGAATLSLVLYCFSPNFLAHGRLATNDVACALLIFASSYTFARFLRAPSRGRFLTWSVLTALAQISKHTALLLFPIFALYFVAVRFVLPRMDGAPFGLVQRSSPRRIAGCVLLFSFVVVVTINLAYGCSGTLLPFAEYQRFSERLSTMPPDQWCSNTPPAEDEEGGASSLPVPLPRAYLEALLIGVRFNEMGHGHGPIYLLGRLDNRGFWYYFPVLLMLKVPLALLLMVGARVAAVRESMARNPGDEIPLFLCPLVVLAFFTTSTAQIGIRYLLPAFPFLYVAVGGLWSNWPWKKRGISRGGLLLAVAWYCLSSLSFFPHYLSYVNEVILDRKHIHRYVADSNVDWGQNQHYLESYLREHGDVAIEVNPPAPVAGRVIVNVNDLVGVTAPAERYAWLRSNHDPVGHIAYSWLVFEVPGADALFHPDGRRPAAE
jgi:hypothetical protein